MEIDDARGLADVAAMLDAEPPSVLVQAEPLVLRISRPPEPEAVAELAARLPAVATVTVVVGHPDVVPQALVDAVDLCLTSALDPPRPWVGAPVELVAAMVAAQPEAALALVALLRSGRTGSTWDRVTAEAATYAMLLGSAGFQRWRAARPVRSRPPSPGPSVQVARDGGVLDIALDRPGVHNAIDTTVRDELVAALGLASTDPTITEVHLRGHGPSFCSGGDLDDFGSVGDPATSFAVRLTVHPGCAVHRVASRTTAHLHGACIGAGIEVPAFAHRVEAQPGTTFRLPELSMGLVPGAGGTVSLPDRIGRHRTAWLALTGATLDAATARAWGLVNELAEPTG